MRIHISTSDGVPIYLQIVNQIKYLAASGRLAPGEQLPPVRKLAEDLVVNPNTVARVYTELEREGILNTRPGLGVFVAQPGSELSRKVRKERLREALDRFLTEAVHLGFPADEVVALVSEQAKQFRWSDKDS